jgi:hypothetical protein
MEHKTSLYEKVKIVFVGVNPWPLKFTTYD